MLNSAMTVAILHDDEEAEVPDKKRAMFYAVTELAVRNFFEARNSHKLTGHDLGRASSARLASCIVKRSS